MKTTIMLTIFRKIFLCVLVLCFLSCNNQNDEEERTIYEDDVLKNKLLDFSVAPLNDDYYYITSKLDTTLKAFMEQKNSNFGDSKRVYRHSRLFDDYMFYLCFEDYETSLILANSKKNNGLVVASQGGDGGDFWEIKSKFLDKQTLEKTYVEGYYTMTEPDTMYISKKIIFRVELLGGKIIETPIDSMFNLVEVLK